MTVPSPRRGEGGPDESRRRRMLWWLLVALLMGWLAASLLIQGQPAASLTYSGFLEEVEAGNVERVTIQGEQISGRFSEPITWPEPEEAEPGQTPREYTRFQAVFPEAVGDDDLLELLSSQGVEVDVEPSGTPLLQMILVNALPFLLILGIFFWLFRRAAQQQAGGLMGFGKSRARRHTSDRPQVTFDDVAGQDQAKTELAEIVDFLKSPEKYHQIGARIPHGVLLVGPPGTGKTLLARAVAGEAHVPFFNLSATEFVEMFVGVGASRVRDLFEKAKAESPSIVFIDELDAIGRRRGAGVGQAHDEREQTLNQLLDQMEGFEEREEVIVLAATNRPDVLDPALLRPGRFDREVTVGLPDREGREETLRIHSRPLRLGDDVDLEMVARRTMGMSGADLANVVNEAALIAARREKQVVEAEDFESAVDKVILGSEREPPMNRKERRLVAYHESGHALVAWLTPDADPVRKVTIVPHGRAGGATAQLPEEERQAYARGYLMARLAVMLGGRAAEEVALGEISTGAESDLVQATRLARRMVTRWGMGDLGPIAFQTDEERPFLGYELARDRHISEDTAARIDREVERILSEQHELVRKLLSEHREDLDLVAERLLEEETLDEEALEELLGPATRSHQDNT